MNLSIAPVGEICKSVNACSRIKSKLFVYDVPNIFKYVVFISPGKKKKDPLCTSTSNRLTVSQEDEGIWKSDTS